MGTLYDKMLKAIQNSRGIKYTKEGEAAKCCELLAIHAQIDLFNSKGASLVEMAKSHEFGVDYEGGVRQGLLLAASLLQKDIQELKQQLS